MNKIYNFELSKKDINRLQKFYDSIPKILESRDFKEYIAEKAEEGLKFIQKTSLTSLEGEDDIINSNYLNSNHVEIEGDTIYLYNDAVIDIASKNMSEKNKTNYPAQLSLAKIVEYGIGYTGLHFTEHQEELTPDWQYDMNNHDYTGWYYKDSSGLKHWTNGFAGRMIFFKLKEYVKVNIEKWIIDYLNKEL